MNIKEIQEEKEKALDVPIEEEDYITEELMKEYHAEAKPMDETEGDAEGKVGVKSETDAVANWGTYGNSITFDPGPGGKLYWKQGPKGTPNYGCGTTAWEAGKQWGSHIKYKGNCTGSLKWFFIGNYDG